MGLRRLVLIWAGARREPARAVWQQRLRAACALCGACVLRLWCHNMCAPVVGSRGKRSHYHYNKRDHGLFSVLPLHRIVPYASLVPPHVTANFLRSQLARLSRRVTSLSSFESAAADYLVLMFGAGYPPSLVHASLANAVFHRGFFQFPHVNRRAVFLVIWRTANMRVRVAAAAPPV